MYTKRENYLKAARFEKPDYIPMTFSINDSCWHHYDNEVLFDLMQEHPLLFPDFKRPTSPITLLFKKVARKDAAYVDDFRCTWETTDDGITGTVVKHPLEDWSAFHHYQFPDASNCTGIGSIDWNREKLEMIDKKARGEIAIGSLRHGHTFLQLCDIRGYQNLIFDFADEEPLIYELIEGVEQFNMGVVRHYLDMEIDVMQYPEDLGMQFGPMLSPEHFIKYIKPSYERLMKPARELGIPIHMHSDGDIKLLVDDLIDGGVQIINMQDLVNGIDWISSRFKGKVCIELDIDRQAVTPYGTPAQVDALIRESVEKIACKEGGLMMIYGLYPGIPVENIRALMDAMEKYAFLSC